MKRNNRLFFTIIVAIVCAITAWADTYEKVTSATQLIPGASYLFANEAEASSAVNGAFNSSNNGNYLSSISVSITNGQFDCPEGAVPLTLGETTNAWTFDLGQIGNYSNNYLYLTGSSSSRTLNFSPGDLSPNSVSWTIDFSPGYLIRNSHSGDENYHIGYNTNNNTFRALTGKYTVSLYKKIERITSMAPDADTAQNPVYWATFSNLNSATFFPASEATVYKVVRTGNRVNENDVVSLTALTSQTVGSVVGYVVPASTGVMIGSSNSQVTYSTTSVESVNDATFFTNNLLHAANGLIAQQEGHTYYKLAYELPVDGQRNNATLGFYFAEEHGAAYTPSPGKAYLDWDGSQGAPARFILREMEETETPTRTEPLSSEAAPRKVLQNGQLLILVNGKRYTVTGQTLQNR